MKKRNLVFIIGIILLNLEFLKDVYAYDVNNIDSLRECISNQEKCTLKSNILNNSESIEFTINKKISFDLNGYSIENVNFKLDGADVVFGDSKTGGNVSTSANYAIYATNSTLTIDNGIFNSDDAAIYSDKSKVTINNGKFNGKHTGMIVMRASNVLINNGEFTGREAKQYSIGVGLSTNSSELIIENGVFEGSEYGLNSGGCGNIQIKNGSYKGENGGIWLSNSISCADSENYTIIEGGTFSGKNGARIEGKNTNVISGGVYNGKQNGLLIQCANPVRETCKDSVLLKGGKYKSSNESSTWPFLASAIFMNSDSNNPVKIVDLLDNEYKLSNESLLEKDGGTYGYYSYLESLDVSIYNPNVKDDNSINDEKKENYNLTEEKVDSSSSKKTIVKVSNTMRTISNIITVVGIIVIIVGMALMFILKHVDKTKKVSKNEL